MIEESILRRAKALNETAKRGGSENEMATAAEKLAALLAQHNLDPNILESDEAVAIISTAVYGKYNEPWRRNCYYCAAQLFYCNYYYAGGSWGVRHTVAGEEHNVAVAVEMGAFFETTINRLANEAARNNKNVAADLGHTARHQFIRSFRLAAAKRLEQRIDEYVSKASAGDLKITDDMGNELRLPALQGLYDRRDALFEEFTKANGIKITVVAESKEQMMSRVGADLGRRAGDSISFTTQVTSKDAAKFALK